MVALEFLGSILIMSCICILSAMCAAFILGVIIIVIISPLAIFRL